MWQTGISLQICLPTAGRHSNHLQTEVPLPLVPCCPASHVHLRQVPTSPRTRPNLTSAQRVYAAQGSAQGFAKHVPMAGSHHLQVRLDKAGHNGKPACYQTLQLLKQSSWKSKSS